MPPPLSRRDLLTTAVALLTACASTGRDQGTGSARSKPVIDTVAGPIPADALGVTLMHEHVLVDFVGADQVNPSRYDPDQVFHAVLPHLRQARMLGCATLVECTPAYLGRDPRLL